MRKGHENNYAKLAQSRRSVAEGNERQRIGNANGNTLTSPGFTTQDIYDPWNRLVRRYQPTQLSGEPAKVIDLYYDADGHRVAKTVWEDTSDFGVPDSFTAYLVDKHSLTGYAQVLEELTAVDPDPFAFSPLSVIRTFAIGHAQISQTQLIDDGTGTPEWTTHFYLYDGQGSVWGLADESGNVTDTYTYEAFGQLLREEGQGTPNSYRYTGEAWDADLGHYYLRARYYEPDRGRFWTMDPFEGFMRDPQSLHKYLYVHGDPINGIDPTGKFRLIETASVGAAIGTLSGLANMGYRAVAQNEVFTFRQVLFEQIRNAGVGAVSGGIAFKFAAAFQPFVKAGVIGNFGLGTGVATSTGFSTAVINEMIDIFILRKPFSIRDSSGNVLQATVVSFVTGGFITRITARASSGEQLIRTTPKPGGGFDTSIDVVVGFGDTLRSPAVSATVTSTASGELSGGALGFLVEKAVEAVYNFSVGD